MVKVLTDEILIDKFLNRGVDSVYPTKEALKQKLMSGQRLRVYQGFDPTGPYLHVGHAMGIRAMRILQQLGHEVIFLVGDFTSKMGDPDKSSARRILSDEEIEKNMAGWKDQAAQMIDFEGENPVQFKRNYEWLSKLRFEDILKLMATTTIQQLLERDMFDKRIKEGQAVGFHELIYPLMQGYDGVAMEVDIEMGGTDQIFNMLMGRHLSKVYLEKEKFVRANKLMEAPEGRTMSKTKGNGINLADSSEDMYGKAMSYPDHLIPMGLELLTDIPMDQIAEITKDIENGVNQMQHKKLMSFEIVRVIRGEADAVRAQNHFEKTVQNKEISEQDMVESALTGEMTIFESLKQLKGTELSGGEIRRTIQQGGVEVNGNKVTDPNSLIKLESGVIIKFGKRTFIKIK